MSSFCPFANESYLKVVWWKLRQLYENTLKDAIYKMKSLHIVMKAIRFLTQKRKLRLGDT